MNEEEDLQQLNTHPNRGELLHSFFFSSPNSRSDTSEENETVLTVKQVTLLLATRVKPVDWHFEQPISFREYVSDRPRRSVQRITRSGPMNADGGSILTHSRGSGVSQQYEINTTQHNATQHNATQHNATQHNTTRRSAERQTLKRGRLGWQITSTSSCITRRHNTTLCYGELSGFVSNLAYFHVIYRLNRYNIFVSVVVGNLDLNGIKRMVGNIKVL